MSALDAPSCLMHASEEVLLALAATSAEEEHAHRVKALELTASAIRAIQRHPERRIDYARLCVAGRA